MAQTAAAALKIEEETPGNEVMQSSFDELLHSQPADTPVDDQEAVENAAPATGEIQPRRPATAKPFFAIRNAHVGFSAIPGRPTSSKNDAENISDSHVAPAGQPAQTIPSSAASPSAFEPATTSSAAQFVVSSATSAMTAVQPLRSAGRFRRMGEINGTAVLPTPTHVDLPDPEIFSKKHDRLRIRVDYVLQHSDNIYARATIEDGHLTRSVMVSGPLAMRDLKDRWLSASGYFVPNKKMGGYIFRCSKFETAWPRFETATRQAFFSVFGVAIDKFCLGRPEREARMAEIEAMMARSVDLLANMTVNPEIFLGKLGFTEAQRLELSRIWFDATGPERVRRALENAKIEKAIVNRIMTKWEDQVYKALAENPYLIIDMGAKLDQADLVAKNLGAKIDNDQRAIGYINDVLNTLSMKGSTVISMAGLLERSIESGLYIDPSDIERIVATSEHIDDSQVMTVVFNGGTYLGLKKFVEPEMAFAEWVSERLNKSRNWKQNHRAEAKVQKDRMLRAARIVLSDMMPTGAKVDDIQAEAVALCVMEPVSILTGGPGTGKTTVCKALIELIRQSMPDSQIFLAAPTNKAARRMSEVVGLDAGTIYNVLNVFPSDDGAVSGGRMLPDNCVLICDESSMNGSTIGGALARNLPETGKLILVGDDGQLKPVGAGQILGDMIRSCDGSVNRVPMTELINLYRQDESGGIAVASKMIKAGEMPPLKPVRDIRGVVSGNYGFIACDESEICRHVVGNIRALLHGGMKIEDIFVLAPMREQAGGIYEINAALSRLINPEGKQIPAHGGRHPNSIPRIGDRFMMTDNYSVEKTVLVANGDVGWIERIEGEHMVLRPDGMSNPVRLPKNHWSRVELGYAGTIHKAQGSQYPVVIMPISRGHSRMLERSLIRTGITRAQDRLLLIGNPDALKLGIHTDYSNIRKTALAGLLEDQLDEDPTALPVLKLQSVQSYDEEYEDLDYSDAEEAEDSENMALQNNC